MFGGRVGLGVRVGGIGVAVGNTSVATGVPVGAIVVGDFGVGLEAPVGRIAPASGEGTAGAAASGTPGARPGAGASVGIGVALAVGAGVAVGISQGVIVGGGVRVTQGFRGSRVGRMRACATVDRVSCAVSSVVWARACCDARSGATTKLSASTSTIASATTTPMSIFNHKCACR